MDFFCYVFYCKKKKKSFYSIECYFPAFPPMERGLQIQLPHKKIPITPMRGLGPGGGRCLPDLIISLRKCLGLLEQKVQAAPGFLALPYYPDSAPGQKRFGWAPLSKLAFWARSWLKSEAQVTSEAHISPRRLPVLSRLSILIAVQHFMLTRKFLKIHLS